VGITEDIRKGKARTVWRMLQILKVQFLSSFNSVDSSVKTRIVKQKAF
jgi:hypothetical protein